MSRVSGLGTDIVRNSRFRQFLERNRTGVLDRLFDEEELAYALAKADPAQHLAARFAAKEACMKCLGRGVWGGMAFREIETVRDKDGRPGLVLHGYAGEAFENSGATHLHLSLTHTETTATALVVMETREPGRPNKRFES